MAARQGRFVWYELMTPDAAGAQAFYSDVVGWQIADAEMPDIDYRICSGSAGSVGGILKLTEDMLSSGMRPAWFGYIAVDDVDNAISLFTGSGGDVLMEPMEIPEVGKFALLADPQGVPIYVIRTVDDGGNAFDRAAIGHCAWNELSTSDYSAAIEFYSGEFNWGRGQEMNMGAIGNYQLLDLDGDDHVGVMPAFEGGPPPFWRFYFRVPALAAAIEKINGAGGTVIHGPQEVPGGDSIVVAIDPQGAMFCLVSSAA